MDTPHRTRHRRLARASAAPWPPPSTERGWRLVVDGRDAARLAAAVAALPRPRPRHRRPRRRRRPGAPRARWPTPSARRLDLLVNNASDLGPSPLPRLADLRPGEFERVLARQHRRPAGAGPGASSRRCAPPAAGSSTSARTPPSRPTRAGAGTARARPRSTSSPPSSPSSTRSCGCTPSTPATWPPTCTRPPSPARTSATGRRRRPSSPALLALVDGDLPSGRYRAADLRSGGGGPMTTTFALPRRRRGHRAAGVARPRSATRCG